MKAKTNEKNVSNVLVVFSWSVFQQGSNFGAFAPKLDHVINAVRLMPGVRLRFMTHLESARPLVSSYGWHFLFRLGYLPILLIAVLVSIPARTRADALKATLTDFWHIVRVRYWMLVLRIKRVDFVLGPNLTAQQIIAARSLGIATIEIQHGLLNESWYRDHWVSYSPDYLACWGNTNFSLLNELGVSPVVIPYPPLYSEPPSGNGSRGRQLLVALGWGSDSSVDGLGAMSQEMFQALEKQLSRVDNVVIRVHPVFPRKQLGRLKTFLRSNFPKARIEYSSARSAGQSILESAVVIAEGTTLVEALLAGKTVICCSIETYSIAKALALDLEAMTDIFLSHGGELSQPSSFNHQSGHSRSVGYDWKILESLVLKS